MGAAKAAEREAARESAVQADIAVTFGDLLKKKRVTRHQDAVLDQELVDEYNELRGQLDLLEAQARIESANIDPDQVAAKQAEVDEFGQRLFAERAVVRFTFGALGADELDELINRHQPTQAQRDQAKKEGVPGIRWNPKTFSPALVHACLVSPALSAEEVAVLWKSPEWNDYELGQLFGTAWLVNQSPAPLAELGKGSGKITPTG